MNVSPTNREDTTLDVSIDGMAQGGDGVGRHNGMVVFATGGLPGEQVRLAITEHKSSFIRGRVIEVLHPSPDRIPPLVQDADYMAWQHIAYAAQLHYKQQIVQEQLERLAKIEGAVVQPVIPAENPWNYRNTAHLHVQGSSIGYYATGTHTLVDRGQDPLLLPVMQTALQSLRPLLQETVTWQVHHVTLRGSATYGQVAAIVYGNKSLHKLAQQWQQTTPTLLGCMLYSKQKLISSTYVRLQEDVGGITFSLSPDSFFQVHTAQTEKLLEVVIAALAPQPGQRILDAYSGVGTFALPLARLACEVVAIEEYEDAVHDGEGSALLNHLDTITFHHGTVERVLPTLAGTFDGVVLDPPRRGCHPAVLETLLKQSPPPPRVVYVSCHPGILARDIRVLLAGGYQLVSVQPVDMFPQTPHIECVALLTR